MSVTRWLDMVPVSSYIPRPSASRGRLAPVPRSPRETARIAALPWRTIVAIELLCRKIGMTRIFTETGECIR